MASGWGEGFRLGQSVVGMGVENYYRARELKERMKERHDAIEAAAAEKHHQLNKEAAEASRQTEQDYEKKTEKEDSLAERKREFDLLMPSKNEVAHARAVAAANKPGSDDVKSAISLADKYTKMMADPLLSRKMTPAQISQMNGAFNTLAKHASSTFRQLRLQGGDLVRMHVILLRQIRYRLLALDRRKRHLRLKGRAMRPSCSSPHGYS